MSFFQAMSRGTLVPPGRKKRLPPDAKPVAISLGGRERIVLSVIEVRRQDRNEKGDSPSEIVADALWHYLIHVEKVPREQIEALLPPKQEQPSNVREFPK